MVKFFNSISQIGLLVAVLLLAGLAWVEPSWAVDNLRLTNKAQDQHHPTVSGSRIVWQDDYAGKSRIYALKIGSAPVRLTNTSSNDKLPRVDGDTVVFERRSAPGALVDSDIWMYRFSTGAASVVSDNDGAQYGPDISGDRVVWYQFNALTGWDIMIKDLSTGSVYQLTKDPGKSLRPRISKNHVVWTDDRFEQFDIFSYDLGEDSDGDGTPNYREDSKPWPDPALRRLTNGAAQDDKPDIDNGRIVWRSFQDNEYKLYWYDLAAPGAGARWVRTVRGIGAKPSITISGNRLAFTDVPAGADPDVNVDLFTRNLISGLTTRVTSGAYRREAPELNGNRLVYQDNRHGWQWDVYRVDFDSRAPAPPGTVTVLDTKKGRELRVSWSVSPASDTWFYDVYRRKGRGPWEFLRRTASRAFYDRGLPQGQRIYYRVRTIDWSGNLGGLSSWGSAVATDKTPPSAPVVRSWTHPNQRRWYKSNDPRLAWTPPADNTGIRGYSYIMDRKMRTVPDRRLESPRPFRNTSNKADGIWYFHVRAKDRSGNWSPPTHFRVRIDSRRPRMRRRSPGKLATGVDRDAPIIVRFSETSNIRRRTLNKDTFYLVHSVTGRKVRATISYNGPTKTARLWPKSRLARKMWYRVRLTTGIKDYAYWRFSGTGWSIRTGTR